MAASVRVGVVGAGYWGPNLIRNFSALGALAAICETCDQSRAKIASTYPAAKSYAEFDDLLASSTIDAVAIATPAETHGELTARALAAGKHVFVEKPLCLDMEEGRRLVDCAAKSELVLMVGHLLLYHPAFQTLRRVVNAGRLGQVRYIYSNRLSLGKIRRYENALWSFAPHDLSMILSLIDAMPEKVMTSGGVYLSPEVADTTLSHLYFGNGIQAHIFVSWLHPFKDHRLVVVGSEAMAEFNDVKSGSDKLLFYPHTIDWQGDIPTVRKAEAQTLDYDRLEPLAIECGHFLNCIQSGYSPDSDGEEGLRVLEVLQACHQSLVTGAPVNLASSGL